MPSIFVSNRRRADHRSQRCAACAPPIDSLLCTSLHRSNSALLFGNRFRLIRIIKFLSQDVSCLLQAPTTVDKKKYMRLTLCCWLKFSKCRRPGENQVWVSWWFTTHCVMSRSPYIIAYYRTIVGRPTVVRAAHGPSLQLLLCWTP